MLTLCSDVDYPYTICYLGNQEVTIELLLIGNYRVDMKRFGKRDRLEVFAGNTKTKIPRQDQKQHTICEEDVSNVCHVRNVDDVS